MVRTLKHAKKNPYFTPFPNFFSLIKQNNQGKKENLQDPIFFLFLNLLSNKLKIPHEKSHKKTYKYINIHVYSQFK